MSVIGVDMDPVDLVLTRGRDFRWSFQHVNDSGTAVDFPAGSLYFEVGSAAPQFWTFVIAGSVASLKVESDVVASVTSNSKWQLVFQPVGEAAGGDVLAYGNVRLQG